MTELARTAGITRAMHVIGGVSAPEAVTEWIDVVNPATATVIGQAQHGTAADVDRAVQAAQLAFPGWAATPMAERIESVLRVRAGIADRAEDLAQAMTAEMGAPIGFTRTAQVGVALADIDALVLAARDHVAYAAVSRSLVVSEPVGVVAAITPWNFPLHQIVLKVCAAMLAGCTVVLKPSEIAPFNAAIFAEIVEASGVPAGVLNVVFGDGVGVGEPLCAHPGVDMVTFTGSRAVGERIASVAARNITKVALELGGKSAAIILEDAPVASSAADVVASCFANAGQTCAALSRALVPRALLSEWQEAARDAAPSWLPGDPADAETVTGPVASSLQQQRVLTHIERAVAEGARVVIGGSEQPAGVASDLAAGAWVQPTILTDVTPAMSIFRDEVFGPVLAITPYDTVDEAIALANDSDYGLAGGVWSADEEQALAVALRVRTGTIGINGAGLDVGAPFGGVKQSGIGRECGAAGFAEFLETKTVMGAAGMASTRI